MRDHVGVTQRPLDGRVQSREHVCHVGYLVALDHGLGIPAEACGCLGNMARLSLEEHVVLNGLLLGLLSLIGLLGKRALT